jgi:protein-histidine pros-kinase
MKWRDRPPFWRYQRCDMVAVVAGHDPDANLVRNKRIRHAAASNYNQRWNTVGLRFKFNIVLGVVFAAGMALSANVSYQLLQNNAKQEVLRDAGLMMEAALAIRGYTVEQVKPHLDAKLEETFLPQAVAAFAATETFNALRVRYPEYTYKEATLNPTNPTRPCRRLGGRRGQRLPRYRDAGGVHRRAHDRDRADALPGAADPGQGCGMPRLPQHGAAAPASMVRLYGEANGFGWKFQEIVGAQIVNVPASLPINQARRTFLTFIGSLAAIFLTIFVVLNVMLSLLIIRPITRMAAAADRISTGDFRVPEFTRNGDEIGVLGHAFNRMRRSLQKALRIMEQ